MNCLSVAVVVPFLTVVSGHRISAQVPAPFPPQRQPYSITPRAEVEAYAATNKTFAAAMDYVVATMDGRQPDHLPPGVTPTDISNAFVRVFPNATGLLDQPISFYGRVLDESNKPVVGANVHFGWRGFLIRGTRDRDVLSDQSGSFSLTGELGQVLYVSVGKSDCYDSDRNRGAGAFQYNPSTGELFRPDPKKPVLYYLRRKGVGARSLITWDNGVKPPVNGTPVKVDLLHRKVGDGPLEISQVKPERGGWEFATNWSITLKIADGGFVEQDEEFPFHPPESGYRPQVDFNFDKGLTNWARGIRKDYYIKFGDPPLYGRLHMDTLGSSDFVRLTYAINPDGEQNLEPPNENTVTKVPVPYCTAPQPLKSKVLFTNATGQVVV
jgi:hypothetical protein